MRILKIIDVNGWAYDFIAQEQQRYSRHEILTKRIHDLEYNDLKNIDILYIPGPDLDYKAIPNVISFVKKSYPQCKIIGAYSGEIPVKYPDADVILSISAKFYPYLKKAYANTKIPVIFLPESVDTNFFTPAQNYPESFTPGWCGRPGTVKRTHILEKLNFPIKRQMDWGKQHFIEGRILDPVKAFYHSLSALVLTSSSECAPRVVFEAMACGLPVISTDVGVLRMVLDHNWLVPVNPEQKVIVEMSKKLFLLSEYPALLKDVGKRNLDYIKKNFSWQINMPLWDTMFDNLSSNDYLLIRQLDEQLRQKWGKLEPALL